MKAFSDKRTQEFEEFRGIEPDLAVAQGLDNIEDWRQATEYADEYYDYENYPDPLDWSGHEYDLVRLWKCARKITGQPALDYIDS